jgi:hypothetical protein
MRALTRQGRRLLTALAARLHGEGMTLNEVRFLLRLPDNAAALDVLMPAERSDWVMRTRGSHQKLRWLITGRGRMALS